MKNITILQLNKACIKHNFIIVRFSQDNSLMGINCRTASFKRFDKVKIRNKRTQFLSYYPCNFMEYIYRKSSFY